MRYITIFTKILLMAFILSSCGQEGNSIEPNGASGSTIQQVSADCNGEACI